jgi:PPOX class probable F420-dependent enzyme
MPNRRAPVQRAEAILRPEERAFIERHRIAHLATADAAGTPHVIPICYALIGDALYFVVDDKPKHSRIRLKRLRNIAANPKVAVVIDDYHEDWNRLAYLLVHGRAAWVDDGHEYGTVLDRLRKRYPRYRSMAFSVETHPMIRITAQRRHFWHASRRANRQLGARR